MAMMEPKAKKKYKTKKKKKKDAIVEELMVIIWTMVGDELHDEKARSIKELVEEISKLLLGSQCHERIPLVTRRKGEDEVNVGSLAKNSHGSQKE
jgi:hypothetical protein